MIQLKVKSDALNVVEVLKEFLVLSVKFLVFSQSLKRI
jgi:hypothetical protein